MIYFDCSTSRAWIFMVTNSHQEWPLGIIQEEEMVVSLIKMENTRKE